MKSSRLRRRELTLGIVLALVFGSLALSAQEKSHGPSKSIDLDKALETKVPENRGISYYYFSLAKWYEDKGNLDKALTEMRNALKYNEGSSAIHAELAGMLDKAGNSKDAIEQAQEAIRLDPADAQPHWLLANIYFRSQGRDRAAANEAVRKGVKELEAVRDLDPSDERAYYALGGAYFELGEVDKAVQAYEKFQSLVPNVDAGYLEIAKYYDKAATQATKEQDKATYQAKAVEYLKKGVQSQPESTESLMYLATLLAKQNNTREAIPVYRQILKLSGDNPEIKRQLAISLVDSGEYEEASQVLDELAKQAPQNKDVLILKGRALVGNHKFPEAVELFKSLLAQDSGLIEAQFYLATAYEQSGSLAEAAKIFEGLLEKSKSDPEEYKANKSVFQQHLAAVYQDMGQNEKAIAIYEDLVKSEPTPNPRLLFLLVNAYRVSHQYDKALALGKQQYDKNPKDTNLAIVYATALADAGKTKDGADILIKTLQADPANVDIYVKLSQIYLQGKRYSDAEKILRRAEDKKLDNERVKFQLATIYERQKDFDRAESMFKEILKEHPKNAIVLNYVGYMLADRGVRLQEAVEYVQEALEIDPNNGAYLDSLGWAFFKLNEFEKAKKYLLQAIDLVKNDPVIHDHLGDLYYKTGEYEKAQDFWNKSLGMGSAEQEDSQKVRDKLEKVQELLRKQKRR